MIAASAAFIGAAAAICALGLVLTRDRPRSRRRPVMLLVALGRRLGVRAAPADLEARLVAAGRPAGLGVREATAAKAGTALVGAAAVAPLAAAAPGRLGFALAALAPAAGFFALDLWLGRLAAARARAVRRELPTLLDLLRVTVEAGASLPAALDEVGGRVGGTLAREWRTVGRRVALGVTLHDAMAEMSRRLPQAEIAAFAAAVERARRHGAPLGETLASQARDVRVHLRARVREQAAKAAPKIQLVVALMLVPSVLLLVGAALLTSFVGSGGVSAP